MPSGLSILWRSVYGSSPRNSSRVPCRHSGADRICFGNQDIGDGLTRIGLNRTDGPEGRNGCGRIEQVPKETSEIRGHRPRLQLVAGIADAGSYDSLWKFLMRMALAGGRGSTREFARCDSLEPAGATAAAVRGVLGRMQVVGKGRPGRPLDGGRFPGSSPRIC